MAVNIDTVYQKVLAIANKEQRGYITPQEFNLFANQAQMDVFEQYFYDINQFSRVPGNDTEYSDMLNVLNEKITSFETSGSCPKNLAEFSAYPTFKLPLVTDFYRLGTVRYSEYTNVGANLCSDPEFDDAAGDVTLNTTLAQGAAGTAQTLASANTGIKIGMTVSGTGIHGSSSDTRVTSIDGTTIKFDTATLTSHNATTQSLTYSSEQIVGSQDLATASTYTQASPLAANGAIFDTANSGSAYFGPNRYKAYRVKFTVSGYEVVHTNNGGAANYGTGGQLRLFLVSENHATLNKVYYGRTDTITGNGTYEFVIRPNHLASIAPSVYQGYTDWSQPGAPNDLTWVPSNNLPNDNDYNSWVQLTQAEFDNLTDVAIGAVGYDGTTTTYELAPNYTNVPNRVIIFNVGNPFVGTISAISIKDIGNEWTITEYGNTNQAWYVGDNSHASGNTWTHNEYDLSGEYQKAFSSTFSGYLENFMTLVEGTNYSITYTVGNATSGKLFLANHLAESIAGNDIPGGTDKNLLLFDGSQDSPGTFTKFWQQGSGNTTKLSLWSNALFVGHLSNVKITNTAATLDAVEVEPILEKDSTNILNSNIAAPTTKRPVYVRKGGHLSVYPTSITSGITCNYIRKPKKPNWGYTEINGTALYNAGASQDFELHESEEVELVAKILTLAGISTKDPSLYQTASNEDIRGIQQEKQ